MKYLKYFVTSILVGILLLQGYFFVQILIWRWVNPSATAFQNAETYRLCGLTLPIVKSCQVRSEWVEFKKISQSNGSPLFKITNLFKFENEPVIFPYISFIL